MKLKLLLAFAIGILVIIALSVYSRRTGITVETREAPADSLTNISTLDLISPPQKETRAVTPVATNPSKTQSAQTNSMDERIFELSELGLSSDSKSFQKIIASLSDTNPVIRDAALEATIQFGNRDAIPILKELAETTEDTGEKIELLNAAKFLELPSLSEVRAQRRTNSTVTKPR